jgi:hypothetical protein
LKGRVWAFDKLGGVIKNRSFSIYIYGLWKMICS